MQETDSLMGNNVEANSSIQTAKQAMYKVTQPGLLHCERLLSPTHDTTISWAPNYYFSAEYLLLIGSVSSPPPVTSCHSKHFSFSQSNEYC